MDIPINFTPEDWERIRRDWGSWWEGELERPLVVIERLEGYDLAPELIPDVVTHAIQFPLDVPAEEVIEYYVKLFGKRHYYGDAFPRFFANFGPGIAAGFMGSKVSISPGTVWFEPEVEYPISELKPAFDPDNIWWNRYLDLTKTAVDRFGDQVTVGYADFGGNLDIFASLHTTNQLLLDFYDAPAEVDRIVREINALWLGYFEELDAIISTSNAGRTHWAQMWAPGRFYMLQSDLSIMISPEMFERFVMPDIAACCEALEFPFYHLDGEGQIRHLDQLLALEKLKGIQWIPGAGAPPPEEWLPLLKRIRDGGKLCQVYVTPEGAKTIIRELGGQGFCFVIFEGLKTDDIDDFLNSLIKCYSL